MIRKTEISISYAQWLVILATLRQKLREGGSSKLHSLGNGEDEGMRHTTRQDKPLPLYDDSTEDDEAEEGSGVANRSYFNKLIADMSAGEEDEFYVAGEDVVRARATRGWHGVKSGIHLYLYICRTYGILVISMLLHSSQSFYVFLIE